MMKRSLITEPSMEPIQLLLAKTVPSEACLDWGTILTEGPLEVIC